MTNKEILDDFKSKYRITVTDYRPLCADFVEDMQGITIWTDEGDVILYFPKQKRTGQWLQNKNGTYSCSLCGSWIPQENRHYAKFCLHCGVRMKEG